MSLILIAIFVASALATISFGLLAKYPAAGRFLICGMPLVLLGITYGFATQSAISPFSRTSALGFGVSDGGDALSISLALFGSIAGVFGSFVFALDHGRVELRKLFRPIAASPLIIIPTIKLIESSGDRSALAYILLFALSYQNGFFWERVLKANDR